MPTIIQDQTLFNRNDEDLVPCLMGNDSRLFSRLYDRFSGALFGIILGKVNDAEVAENLLQDVFIKAWRCRHLYDPAKGRLFTWLYNITRSLCIDYLRSKAYKKNKVSVLSEDMSALLPDMNADTFSPDNIGLREIVNTLKYEEKEVIELMYFGGFTQREIAKMKDIPLGTVKTRMRRGIKHLRFIFTADWENSRVSLN